MKNFEKLYNFASNRYSPIDDFPALNAQYMNWREQKPLDGLKVLDASPVFENTFPKYAALCAAGAELFISDSQHSIFDESALSLLPDFGVTPLSKTSEKQFDIILDCGALYRKESPTFGFAELTRTGAIKFEGTTKKVFVADNSLTKEFETTLGTGDGFSRAIEELGLSSIFEKTIMVFGCGKVGRGIIMACAKRGANVISADLSKFERIAKKFGATDFASIESGEKVLDALRSADCIVSATGIKDAVKIPTKILADKNKIFANMGVEDEFGDSVPASRALNEKRPLNFILKEPTQLKFIDPTLALHNYGATEILSPSMQSGTNKPSQEIEDIVLANANKEIIDMLKSVSM